MSQQQQFGNSNIIRPSNKRRMDQDDIQEQSAKRFFDLNTTFSPEPQQEKVLPAITFASPDYRPPPPTETPLWLQPIHSPSSVEEDSEEDEFFTPSLQQDKQKSSMDYWPADMMMDYM